jgi:hypothetical protein
LGRFLRGELNNDGANTMRNILLAGTAGLLLAAAVTMANATEQNPNVPNWSPYAIMGFGGNANAYANPGYGGNPGYPPRPAGVGMDEGRAAYVDPFFWAHPAGVNNGMGDINTGYDNSRENSAYPPVPGTMD